MKIEIMKNEWSAKGRRVLLLAHKTISRDSVKASTISSAFETEMLTQARSGLTLVGLVAIVDPPRPEIPDVIRTLKGAGIRIFMVRHTCVAFNPNLLTNHNVRLLATSL